MTNHLTKKDVFELYEQGKHRRYSLLFSVNGGAFAIGKLFVGDHGQDKVAGDLKLWMLAAGTMLFSGVMCFDIWMFGEKMKTLSSVFTDPNLELFNWRGKVVLVLLGLLLVAAWGAVAGPTRICSKTIPM